MKETVQAKNIAPEEFIPDSRFARLGKDAIKVAVGWVLLWGAFMAIAYFFGSGNPADYTYVMGFPLWFFLTLVVQLAFMGITIYMLNKKFADISLDPEDPNYDYDKEDKE